ncbi:MAG: phenylalanine--tRNA ligase subunit beta [Microbacterium sp. SCN 70-200]|uniref:phenylalanine--tRNA ligase subunit beta n=1 Tax=unclassified Microbacterium TaxID=2609290 RepID=UPI00086B78BC|nr:MULTISPECIES: phenylalanine--tRNA ligase subunit beta [unclassified Microbacterium]MBN9214084.1 phenylalanine--tRNA ligase subunit beta [Microbacterium sp.]ODT39721.1 MAG: phenylalanine--tRNA ligase subunit beta [Microbacterium sp. SCN 70-200]OJV82798.1 MAG: phenylalanine--tRNA ligase subunit beta [Microbacterium sp. 70-16]
MRVPLSWLREYVDVPADATPEDVLASLVSVGFEEEDVHGFGLTGPIVVGQVVEFTPEPQSNGKTIRWCQVDVGEANGGVRGIVCGAGNFFVGDKVVVTLPGAVLPGPFPIAARKTYGHVSDGMIASARELGLGDEHSGILRLVELGLDPEVGTDAIALLGLDDVAVEINVTPDRGYALSLRGVAREYAHATGAPYRDPGERAFEDLEQPASGFAVSVIDEAPIRGRVGASEFVVRIVRDVDPTKPTPPWMIARLTLAGIRSLGILIDITNYVMLELGNPIHGYDLDTVRGGITVRRAAAGEKLTTLDGKERTLSPEDLLITDESGPIGLAGVMGGGTTEMTDATRNVLIEAAIFDTVSIARTARRHKLPSEASKRFERGVDPLIPFVAARRVADLMVAYAGGTLDTETGGALFAEVFVEAIELPRAFVSRLIGVDYTDAEVTGALETVGCEVSAPLLDVPVAERVDGWEVIPPSWRPDLTDKWTLAEEVARINGYDRIPSVLPVPPSGRGFTPAQAGRRRVANALAAAGFVETPSFGFTTAEQNDLHGSASGEHVPSVKLANPLDGQAPFLRRTLVPGLLHVAHRNVARGFTDLALFETGSVFLPEPGVNYGTDTVPAAAVRPDAATLAALDAAIPPQPRHVAVLLTGHRVAKQPGQSAEAFEVADALDAIRTIAVAAGVEITVAQTQRAALHPGRAGVLSVGDTEVGYVGELHPQVSADADLPGRVLVAELDLDLLLELAGDKVVAANLSGYPAATQDVSLVVDAGVPAGAVSAALVEGAGSLLEALHIVDDYRGQGVPEGSKSLTFALRFRADDRTLTAAEATEAKLAGVAVASARFGAVIRE